MAKPPGSTPSGRKPSYRGAAMTDLTRGKPRVRAWPRTRPGKGTKEQEQNRDKFRQIQKAANFVAPEQAKWLRDQVEGSPLLPRDAFTMMMSNRLYAFQLPNGRILWPMPARDDVSQSLDAVAAQPGDTLIRGENGWEARTGGPVNGAGLIVSRVLMQGSFSTQSNVNVIVPFNYIDLDPLNWWDNASKTWTPSIAGIYAIAARVRASSNAFTFLWASKNGAITSQMADQDGSSHTALSGVGIVQVNGTTDSIGVYQRSTSNRNYNTNTANTWACLIGPLA